VFDFFSDPGDLACDPGCDITGARPIDDRSGFDSVVKIIFAAAETPTDDSTRKPNLTTLQLEPPPSADPPALVARAADHPAEWYAADEKRIPTRQVPLTRLARADGSAREHRLTIELGGNAGKTSHPTRMLASRNETGALRC
jgi:hypothetical protein